jgi:hypothetical protein
VKLYHVEQREDWKTAPKECRSEFIELMRDKTYGAQETLDAWEWYSLGWAACYLFAKPKT